MGKPQSRKGHRSKHKEFKKSRSTKNRAKDLDQVQDELRSEAQGRYNPRQMDEELPGMGRFPCVACSRWFINESVLVEHCRTKAHKKRLKLIAEPQYTQAEAEAAAGMGSAVQR